MELKTGDFWRETIILILVLLPFIVLTEKIISLDVHNWVIFSGYVLLGWIALLLDSIPGFFNNTF